jgi:two-component system sensor histidine kinase/response regulator
MSLTPLAQLLIVDDEAAHLQALCDTLQDQGYATSGFTLATEALAALQKQKFDLLLTDLMMPEMDGIALLRAALEIDPQLVGIMMTGQGTISTAVEAMQSGALDYILKPFKLDALLAVLSRALAVRQLRLENLALQQRVSERTAELETANRELEAFSYSVSHDLRAPLRHIDGYSNMLLETAAARLLEEDKQLLGKINASAVRMRELIEGLLSLSRLGRQPLSKQPLQLAGLVQQELDELSKEREGRTVEVHVDGLPDCVGDPSLLKQVFANLLSNAFKFTRGKERAVIGVGCWERGGETVYFVRDNGAGFDLQYAEKLFVPFQRLHRADDFDGTGVGLTIVQRIIHRHGGRIWAEAEVDKGAAFYFTLGNSQH